MLQEALGNVLAEAIGRLLRPAQRQNDEHKFRSHMGRPVNTIHKNIMNLLIYSISQYHRTVQLTRSPTVVPLRVSVVEQ